MDTVFQKSRPERSRYFKVGDRVIARDYKGKDHKWIGGQIESSDGPLMYKVKTDLGSTWRRHVDQIKPSKIAEDIAQNTPLIEEPSVETTENTKTDVQTDNINDKPIDGPSTDKLHYTKINASEVCPQNVIIRGLLCLNTV
jgi:hypothetical protein